MLKHGLKLTLIKASMLSYCPLLCPTCRASGCVYAIKTLSKAACIKSNQVCTFVTARPTCSTHLCLFPSTQFGSISAACPFPARLFANIISSTLCSKLISYGFFTAVQVQHALDEQTTLARAASHPFVVKMYGSFQASADGTERMALL